MQNLFKPSNLQENVLISLYHSQHRGKKFFEIFLAFHNFISRQNALDYTKLKFSQ